MIPVKLPFRLPAHIVASAEEVANPALRRLWLCCDHCGGEEDWLVDAGRELYWTAGRFLNRHHGCGVSGIEGEDRPEPDRPAAGGETPE